MLANETLRKTDLEAYLQRLQEVVYDWKGIMILQPRKVDYEMTKVRTWATQKTSTMEKQAVCW